MGWVRQMLLSNLMQFIRIIPPFPWDFPVGSTIKVSAYSAGDPDSIPGSGRSPGEGNGNPL